ncbi:hypothetical protein Amsp01_025410 [Amycolatopsis sp. NBRC 101858]|nr:hypothetical protein Amsp01_025410 [Amycolatopsis sp. NBRC 101858]
MVATSHSPAPGVICGELGSQRDAPLVAPSTNPVTTMVRTTRPTHGDQPGCHLMPRKLPVAAGPRVRHKATVRVRRQSNISGSFAAVSSSAGVYVDTVISERRP